MPVIRSISFQRNEYSFISNIKILGTIKANIFFSSPQKELQIILENILKVQGFSLTQILNLNY